MSYKFTKAAFLAAPQSPTLLTDLLAMDEIAAPHGSGLHPRLRAALQAGVEPAATVVLAPRGGSASAPGDLLVEPRLPSEEP